MDHALNLKIAAFILFWFGIVAQIIIMGGIANYFYGIGYHDAFTELISKEVLLNGVGFTWIMFGHFTYVVAGYWLSKGTKKGTIFGLALSSWGIIGFLIPFQEFVFFTPEGIITRVLLVLVIWLVISGRKDLTKLKSQNWRPWKNPKAVILKN